MTGENGQGLPAYGVDLVDQAAVGEADHQDANGGQECIPAQVDLPLAGIAVGGWRRNFGIPGQAKTWSCPQISSGLRQPASSRASNVRNAALPVSFGTASKAACSRSGVVRRSLTARIVARASRPRDGSVLSNRYSAARRNRCR